MQETLGLLEERVNFFTQMRLSAENILTMPNGMSVRSLSEIVPQLCNYSLAHTPLHPALAEIYLGKDAIKNGLECASARFLLPAVSDGEDSITEEESFEPSFRWLASSLVDSTLLETDKVEPRKVERGRIAAEWKGVHELLLFNVDCRIHVKAEMRKFEEALKVRFEKYPWIKVKRLREIYYRGRPSVILRFHDDNSTPFAHFNLVTLPQKDPLGPACEVYRITQNRLKDKCAEATLVFRKLPLNMTKEMFLGLFKRVQPTWMEELSEIAGYRYTICKVPYMEDAFQMVAAFQAKAIKDAKVNYHPRSAKIWRPIEPADPLA